MNRLRISVLDSSIAGRVRFWRAQRGLSRSRVALAAGLTDGWLSNLEQGRIEHPDPRKLHALAPVLGTSYEDLMGAAGYIESTPMPDDVREFALLLSSMTDRQRDRVLRMLYILLEPDERPLQPHPAWVS